MRPALFRMTDGRVTTLPEGCLCATHPGIPHWLHYDHLVKRINDKLIHPDGFGATHPLTLLAYAEEEARRLGESAREMERAGVAEVLDHGSLDREGT